LWAGKLRLLNAQCLLAGNRIDDAWAVLLSGEIRGSPHAVIGARRRMLEAAVLNRRDRFGEADAAFEDAWAKASAAADSDTLIEIQLSRALSYARRQDLARGRVFLDSAHDLALRHNDGYHQAAALLNIALFAAKRSRFDEAALTLQRVLAQCERRSDTGIIRAAALGNLSMCYSRLGDFERAIEMRRQAIAFQEKAGLRLYLSQSFGEMGYLHLLAGDAAQAAPWFEKASNLAQATGAGTETALWQGGLAQALTLAGDLDAAEQATRQALKLRSAIKDPGGEAWIRLTEARIAARRGRQDDAIHVLRNVLSSTEEAQLAWEAHADLAQIFSGLGQPILARRHHREALRLIEHTTSELLRTEYQITFLSRLIGFYQSFVQALIDDGQDRRALEVADATHARTLAERLRSRSPLRPKSSAAAFQQMARSSGAVILSYWLSPHGSNVWAITGDGIQRRRLPPESEIRKLVDLHSMSIDRLDDPVTLASSAAARLYDAVVAPVHEFIPRGSKVILVPDGPLHNINFETLVAAAPKPHYWIEDVTISVAPSLGVLERDDNTGIGPDDRLLLIGDPHQADPAYPELRFASDEVKNIRQRFPNLNLHTRGNATPASYLKSASREYAVIHFAAHAEANRVSPMDSAIILSPETGRYKLYSRDVIELPIAAKLVTLSACRGAGARTYSGEGLVGFAWAFLDAGARNVIAGLWDVSDRSTAALMARLYEGTATEKADPAEALRRAKLSLLHAKGPGARPWYWGPFQTYTRAWRSAQLFQARQYTKRH
jgi:CHAT domain-containing protein